MRGGGVGVCLQTFSCHVYDFVMTVCMKVSSVFVGVVGKKMEACVSMLEFAQVACGEVLECMVFLIIHFFIGFL